MLDPLLIVGLILVAVDLIMTLFGKPLFKPGPIAKSMFPGLNDDDGYL